MRRARERFVVADIEFMRSDEGLRALLEVLSHFGQYGDSRYGQEIRRQMAESEFANLLDPRCGVPVATVTALPSFKGS